MPRGPRDDAPGAIHHVMARGIERSSIFRDDADRWRFLDRLSRLVLELGFLCFAWALMPNHFHLVLRTGRVRVSCLMARLGTGYARYFNERHDRVGHLFQNRFRSRRALDDADLMGLVLYVHRNPLEAGIVADALELEDFPWCGHGALLGRRPAHPFEAVPETLELFGSDPVVARRRVRTWLAASPERAAPEAEPSPIRPALAAAKSLPPSAPAFAGLLEEACASFRINRAELLSRRRNSAIAAARRTLAVRAVSELGMPAADVARKLGVTASAVTRMLDRAVRPNKSTSQGTSPPGCGGN